MRIAFHEDLSRKEAQTESSDRAFGLVIAAFLFIVSLWPMIRGRNPREWAAGAGAVFLIAAWLSPKLLHPLNRVWTEIGRLIGRVTNFIILGVMFYIVFTPIAAFFKLVGRDPLRLKFDRDAESYWIPRNPPGPSPETMRNQF